MCRAADGQAERLKDEMVEDLLGLEGKLSSEESSFCFLIMTT